MISSTQDLTFIPVRSHLPFILHWQSRAEVQGSHLPISCEQAINSVKDRLFLWYVMHPHTLCSRIELA